MALHAGGNRVVVTHNPVTQRVIRADLFENSIFSSCTNLVKILITLTDNRFPNQKLRSDGVSQLVVALIL